MKKLFALLLVLATLIMCCSCKNPAEQGDNKQTADNSQQNAQDPIDPIKEAEAIAKQYLECLLNAKLSEVEPMVLFDTEAVVTEGAKQHPGDISYEDGKVEIDGESFESIDLFVEAAEDKLNGISIASLEYKETTTLTGDELKSKVGENPFAMSFLNTLDSKALEEIVCVNYDVTIKFGDETNEGLVSVLLVDQDGEWKVLSPTWTSWILLEYAIFE